MNRNKALHVVSGETNKQYSVLTRQDSGDDQTNRFARDVLTGLSKKSKSLPSKYFYDAVGERLFREITQLDEYYLTRCENEILTTRGEDIAREIGDGSFNLVELGPGDGSKTRIILQHFLDAQLELSYVPIDICEPAIRQLIEGMKDLCVQVAVDGLVAEYTDGLKWLANQSGQRNVVLFLGSNVGNFDPTGARVFLRNLRNALNGGDLLLIGFDLKKDLQTINAAYNDSQNVTAAFNLNLLERINRELGGDFDIDQFEFYSGYNVFSGAVESYLVSRIRQEVRIEALNQKFSFEPSEPIHTEYSHKFLLSEVEELAKETKFQVVRQFTDSREYFVDSLWAVKKD